MKKPAHSPDSTTYWEPPFTARYYLASGELVVEMPFQLRGSGWVKVDAVVADLKGEVQDSRGRFVSVIDVDIPSERVAEGDKVSLTQARMTPTVITTES